MSLQDRGGGREKREKGGKNSQVAACVHVYVLLMWIEENLKVNAILEEFPNECRGLFCKLGLLSHD